MTPTPENKEQTAQNENTLILKIFEWQDNEIQLEVDANTSQKVVHACVVNLLPNVIKQFAENLAGEDKEFEKHLIGHAVKELTGGVAQVHQVDVRVQDMKPVIDLLVFAKAVAEKFVAKVEDGRAKSKETYKDMQDLLGMIQALQAKAEEEPATQEPQQIQEWKPYTGDYEKQFYDVKDKDGNIFTNCWPNAWFLNVPDSDTKFAVEDNVMIRPSLDQ